MRGANARRWEMVTGAIIPAIGEENLHSMKRVCCGELIYSREAENTGHADGGACLADRSEGIVQSKSGDITHEFVENALSIWRKKCLMKPRSTCSRHQVLGAAHSRQDCKPSSLFGRDFRAARTWRSTASTTGAECGRCFRLIRRSLERLPRGFCSCRECARQGAKLRVAVGGIQFDYSAMTHC